VTDEAKPKRVRGQKEQEAYYRAGFCDGLAHALHEMKLERSKQEARDLAMRDGAARLREAPLVPKRTRRKRGEERPPNSAHSASESAGPI
jgi:hypothetical protein